MLVLTAAVANVTSRPSARRPSAAALPSDQNTTTLAASTKQQAPEHRALAQPRRLPEKIGEVMAARPEAFDDPVGQSKQPQLLGGRRIDREPVGIVGMALGVANFFGVAVAPDGALAQQPVRGEPCAREQDRRPPRVAGEHDRRGEAPHHLHQPAGDEVHRYEQRRPADAEIEIAGHREVARELRDFRGAPCPAARRRRW